MSHEIIDRSLDVFTRPSKPVSQFLARHFERRYAGRYRFARTLFVIDYLIITAAVALAVLSIVVSTAAPTPPERVRILMRTEPVAVKSGDRAIVFVEYENREHDPVGPVSLRTNFPSGFELTDPPPGFLLHDRTINLGTLEAGARGELAFTGVLRVPVGTIQRFYISTIIGGEVRTTALPVKVKSSVLAATVTAPPRIIDDEPFTATLELRNTGSVTLTEVVVTPKLPIGSSAPTSTLAFAPGAIARFSYTLTAGEHEGALPVGFEVALREGGALIRQGIAILTVKHIKTGLNVETNFDDAPLRFDGKDRKFKITVTNRGTKTLRDATLHLDLPAAEESDWTLGTLAPGGSATVATTIKLTAPASDDQPPFALVPVVSVEVGLDGESDRVRVVRPQKPLPIASDFRVNSTSLYYTAAGEQLGRGPLPPEVGRVTTFWIAVEFTHRGNEIKNLEFRGWLPLNVRWTDRHATTLPAGSSVTYDRDTRRVSIKVPTLPVEGKWTTTFAVDIVPTRADLGKAPWLFLPETVSGHEMEVNVPLDLRLGAAVTTVEIVGR